CAIGRIELAIQAGRRFPDVVEKAVRGLENGLALFFGIALAEQPEEHLARIVLHRQRLIRRAERDHAARLGAQLERGQRRLFAEVLGRDLVDRDADARLRIATTRVDAIEPGLLDDAVRARALAA